MYPFARLVMIACSLISSLPSLCPEEKHNEPATGVTTWRLGSVFNGAVAQLEAGLVLTENVDRKLVSRPPGRPQSAAHPVSGFSCKSNHSIRLYGAPCPRLHASHLCQLWKRGRCLGHDRSLLNTLPRKTLALAELEASQPDRPCQDELNFRGRGPEDARVLPLHGNTALILYNDYAPCTVTQPSKQCAGQLPYHRTIYIRELRVSMGEEDRLSALLGDILRVQPGDALPQFGAVEKNWAPFAGGGGFCLGSNWIGNAPPPQPHPFLKSPPTPHLDLPS